MSTHVDTRELKSGHMRLRFKLNKVALEIVSKALKATDASYTSVALDGICLEYLSCSPHIFLEPVDSLGKERLLVKLHPDEYETVREAMNEARKIYETDNDALVHICQSFMRQMPPLLGIGRR